jgi:hypothetical protein
MSSENAPCACMSESPGNQVGAARIYSLHVSGNESLLIARADCGNSIAAHDDGPILAGDTALDVDNSNVLEGEVAPG